MSKKGGVTIPIFDCIYNGAESITSFERDFDEKLYEILPNLYTVCIADNSQGSRNIVGGFFVKTSYTHNNKEFEDSLHAAALSSPNLSQLLGPEVSFLPARLGVSGSAPLSEQEMLRVMITQFLKFSQEGSA